MAKMQHRLLLLLTSHHSSNPRDASANMLTVMRASLAVCSACLVLGSLSLAGRARSGDARRPAARAVHDGPAPRAGRDARRDQAQGEGAQGHDGAGHPGYQTKGNFDYGGLIYDLLDIKEFIQNY